MLSSNLTSVEHLANAMDSFEDRFLRSNTSFLSRQQALETQARVEKIDWDDPFYIDLYFKKKALFALNFSPMYLKLATEIAYCNNEFSNSSLTTTTMTTNQSNRLFTERFVAIADESPRNNKNKSLSIWYWDPDTQSRVRFLNMKDLKLDVPTIESNCLFIDPQISDSVNHFVSNKFELKSINFESWAHRQCMVIWKQVYCNCIKLNNNYSNEKDTNNSNNKKYNNYSHTVFDTFKKKRKRNINCRKNNNNNNNNNNNSGDYYLYDIGWRLRTHFSISAAAHDLSYRYPETPENINWQVMIDYKCHCKRIGDKSTWTVEKTINNDIFWSSIIIFMLFGTCGCDEWDISFEILFQMAKNEENMLHAMKNICDENQLCFASDIIAQYVYCMMLPAMDEAIFDQMYQKRTCENKPDCYRILKQNIQKHNRKTNEISLVSNQTSLSDVE